MSKKSKCINQDGQDDIPGVLSLRKRGFMKQQQDFRSRQALYLQTHANIIKDLVSEKTAKDKNLQVLNASSIASAKTIIRLRSDISGERRKVVILSQQDKRYKEELKALSELHAATLATSCSKHAREMKRQAVRNHQKMTLFAKECAAKIEISRVERANEKQASGLRIRALEDDTTRLNTAYNDLIAQMINKRPRP
jgi:hypothetical protein